jgi:PAS domain S-box-containing protein
MARILIVEDESVAAWYLQEALESVGHQVVGTAASGEEAIPLAAETQPQLVLMDIRLQGEMDGIATANQIYSRFNLPIVYLTAHADDATLSRAIATNPYGYLVKPFQEREVHTTIEIALRRYELEKRTENTKNWFANALNSIGDATIVTDCNGNITLINPAAEALTEWTQQEVQGQAVTTILTLIHRETRKTMENPLFQAMREGAAVSVPSDCLLLTKSGREIEIGNTAAPMRKSTGEIIGGVMVFQNISPQQAALSQIKQRNLILELSQVSLLARLQEQTAQLQQALTCTQVLKPVIAQARKSANQIQIFQTIIQELGHVLEADYCWVTLYNANRTLATISCEYIAKDEGNSYPSALGTRIEIERFPDFYDPLLRGEYWLSPPFDVLPTPYKLLLTAKSEILSCPLIDEEVAIGEISILRTGQPHWSPLQAALISQVVGQCTAVVGRSHSHETAQNYVEDLELLNHIKDNFLSSISQELSTPLTNMKMAVEMLSSLVRFLQSSDQETETPKNQPLLWEKMEQYLRILREEWQREFDLINSLLNFQSLEQRLEHPGESFPLNPIDLQQWLPELVNRFSEQAVRQRQLLSCQVAHNLTTIVSHEPSLDQLVSELLTNACKFSPPDSWIAVSAEVRGENATIVVTNTGITIPSEEFSRIFQPFYRITQPNRWNYSGTGLGLALVKKLVKLLDGEIRVRSQSGETTFTVILSQNFQSLKSAD